MDNNKVITDIELSILSEIGNIGAGNAANALSVMVNKPVGLEVPELKICDLIKIPEHIGKYEEIRTGIFFGVSEALNGFICFLLEDEASDKLIQAIGYECDPSSILSEVGNIISGSYVGALSTLINECVNISPPEYKRDMTGAMMDALVCHLAEAADESVLIKTKLTIDEVEMTAHYILLLEEESLNKLLDYMKKMISL